MPSPRFTSAELQKVLARQGYGIKSEIGPSALSSEIGSSRTVNNVEPDSSHEQVVAKRLQIKCSGKVRVRIKFYRRRLADYSRAISEKALVDALQYSGLLHGDSEKEIWLIDEGQEKVADKKDERTEIILEYPELDLDDLWEESKRKDGR